jgi:hypothetical protein
LERKREISNVQAAEGKTLCRFSASELLDIKAKSDIIAFVILLQRKLENG